MPDSRCSKATSAPPEEDEQRLRPAAVVGITTVRTGLLFAKNVEDERNRRKYPQIGGEAADGTSSYTVFQCVASEQVPNTGDDRRYEQQRIFLV